MATKTTRLQLTKPAGLEMPDVDLFNENMDILDEEVGIRPKTINGSGPDANGNIQIDRVENADNLSSSQSQQEQGTFIRRTSGGAASLDSGSAWLLAVRGGMVHNGYVAEVLEMTVTNAERGAGVDGITATLDRDTFIGEVDGSGTYTFSYASGWSEDPSEYGITVTGTPVNGDVITVVYVEEERGEIIMSTPTRFVATGWNLYEPTNGYARVTKYSDQYGYRIVGAYTVVQWAATTDGARTTLTIGSGGLFQVPGDGYVFVTNGNSTTTAIYATWADKQAELPDGSWTAYTESAISLQSILTSYFPYGLCRIGTAYDEINLTAGTATSAIDRMAYSSANLATAEASGRAYEYDEDYIYIVKETPDSYSISVSGLYQVHEYGMEFFDETDAPAWAWTQYGQNLKNKLERDVLQISAQTLTAEQKAQVRTNIGAGENFDIQTLGGAGTAAVTNGYITNVNSNISIAQLRIFKTGHVVMLAVYVSNTTAALSDNTVLFNVADSIKPIYGHAVPLFNGDRRLHQSRGVQLNVDNNQVILRTSSDLAAGSAFRFSSTYITAG